MIVKESNTATEFYLSEQKARFKTLISDNENDIYNYGLLFRTTAKYENFFGKDVIDFTRSQLIAMFEDMESTASTFEKRYRYLERYFESFGKRIFDFSFYDLDIYTSVRRCNIRDKEEFLYIINNSFKPDEPHTLDIVRKGCVILLYLGVPKSVIPELRKEDYDNDATTLFIRTVGITRKVPLEFALVLNVCKNIQEYISVHPKLGTEVRRIQENNYLIRGDAQRNDSQKCSTTFIDKIFMGDTFDVVNKNLTPTRVFESGLYHSLYNIEKSGAEFIPGAFRKAVELYLNKEMPKYQHLFQNYCSWKKAFGL